MLKTKTKNKLKYKINKSGCRLWGLLCKIKKKKCKASLKIDKQKKMGLQRTWSKWQNKNCLEGCWSCFNVVWVLMQGSSGNPQQFHTLPGKNKSCLGICKKSKQKWSSQIQKNCQGKQKLPWKLKNVSFSNWSDNKENKSGLQTNIALNSPMKIE